MLPTETAWSGWLWLAALSSKNKTLKFNPIQHTELAKPKKSKKEERTVPCIDQARGTRGKGQALLV